MKQQRGILFVLSAPSGTGKTSVCKIIREKLPQLAFSVSHTTRAPRPGERHGVDYYFIAEAEFQEKIRQEAFLEWAKVHGCYYGTAAAVVEDTLRQGRDILLEIDVQGAESLRRADIDGVFICILPPSIQELERRLRTRGTEPEEKIHSRIDIGKKEISKYKVYDYALTNYDIDETAADMLAIFRSEKCRAQRYLPTADDIAGILKGEG